MNKFTSLTDMYSSSEYREYISDKLGNDLFIDDPERAERICAAAEDGCDGSLHCEIIEDWRGFLGTLVIKNYYSDPDDYYGIDEATEDHIRAEIDSCEKWHINNGSYESQLRGNTMNKFYAVIQHGHVCFGVGRSREAAIADASEWLDCDEPLVDTQLVEWYNAVDGDLVMCECTEAYYRAVLVDGSVSWDMDNGVIKLEGE